MLNDETTFKLIFPLIIAAAAVVWLLRNDVFYNAKRLRAWMSSRNLKLYRLLNKSVFNTPKDDRRFLNNLVKDLRNFEKHLSINLNSTCKITFAEFRNRLIYRGRGKSNLNKIEVAGAFNPLNSAKGNHMSNKIILLLSSNRPLSLNANGSIQATERKSLFSKKFKFFRNSAKENAKIAI